jgi:zinc protease
VGVYWSAREEKTTMSPSRAAPLLLAATLSAAVGACAAAGLPDAPVLKPYEPKRWVAPLKSGLRVLVEEDRSAPLAVVVSVYNVGGSSDPKGVEGLAHFVEHLAFRSRPGGKAQLWDHLKRMGAFFNAYTTSDVTVYHAVAHKDRLHELLQLEAWRLARTLEGVTPEVFATEREVVRNELRQRRETTVGSRMFDVVLGSLFPPGHPLSRPVVGSHESLSAATLEHAQAFVAKHYRPDNCTIVVAGDVDTEEVKKMLGMWPAEILFGPQGPDGPAVSPRTLVSQKPVPPVPPPHRKDLVRNKGPITQPQLLLAWSAPGAHRGNDALLDFVASRLNLALLEGLDIKPDDDIEGVGAFTLGLGDASLLLVEARLKPDSDVEKARVRLLDTLVHTWTTELGHLDTEITRWTTATDLLLETADLVSKAEAIAVNMANTGKPAYFKETLEEVAKVKPGHVLDFAYKWLQRDRAVTVYFEPEGSEVPRAGGGPAGGARPAAHDIGRDDGTDPSTVGGLGSELIRQIARSPALGRLPRFKLQNGLELVVIKQGTAPVAQIQVSIRGGDASVRPYGLASLAMALSYSRCQDHGSLLPVGGYIGGGTGSIRTTFSGRMLSGNISNGIAVLSDRVACREVDEEVFLHLGRILERRTKAYQRAIKRPEALAQKKLGSELYPDHPYGEWAPDPGALRAVKLEDAQGFVRSHLRPENAVAVVFGDVDPAEVRALGEKYLTRWPGGAGSATALAPPAATARPTARKLFLIDRAGATQAQVAVGCRLAEVRPERLPAYDVLEALANERAWALREEWGATYGINAHIATLPGGAAHLIWDGAVENAQTGQAVARLLALADELGTEKVAEGTFLLKRWDVARQFSWRFAHARQMAGAVLTAAEHGWPLEVWDLYPERLAETTPKTLREITEGCVGKEIVTVVGDATVLRPQLEAAGLRPQGS